MALFTKWKMFFILAGTAIIFILIYQAKHFDSKNLNIYEKIAEGDSYNYLIIGDSIGRGSGAEEKEMRWFNQLEAIIEEEYRSNGRRQSIVQSGATAFEGIYKLQHTHMTRSMDLIFIVFGENDRKYMDPEKFAFFYEKLIRNAKELHPDAELVTIIESPLRQEPYADSIKRLSIHYGAKYLDMRIPFKESGMLTEQLTSDMVHPNGNGYQLYAYSIFEMLKKNIEKRSRIAQFPKPLFKNQSFLLTDKGKPSRTEGFQLKRGIYISDRPGEILEFEFSGPLLGIKTIRSEEGGMMNVYIDGEYVRSVSTWWPFERERYLYITSGLEDTRHTVRFETIKEVSARNVSQRSTIQISSIIVAEDS
ncbi:SGNH/GDSL hydrolase family protein [Bacillus sp. REN3]|uniref:SGNH/GDSL hydrolase family protein n=1 Tax=Bacillus sp. REN3 TaxID=2802440 RepID=UPI001AEEF1ED|nr:SGNH/GDSL hydrolase family protein [Bacillus sp. REN3]